MLTKKEQVLSKNDEICFFLSTKKYQNKINPSEVVN